MSKALHRYWLDLRRRFELTNNARKQYLYQPARHFTRQRFLHFDRTVGLILSLLKKSLSIELFDFFNALGLPPVSKSAFVQAREKIHPVFFHDLFFSTSRLFYRHFGVARWRGFRLWACDGTGLRLPNEPGIGEHFGWHQNQYSRVPSTRMLCIFDVLNQLIVHLVLHPREQSERRVAFPLIKDIPKDVVMIYDRGFCGYALLWLHQLAGSHCIVRLPINFSPQVIAFIESGKRQQRTVSYMGDRSVRYLRKKDYRVSRTDQLAYRLIRVDLPDGTVEVLMTTLTHTRQWPVGEFKKLYGLRWGVETCFHLLKSYFQATLFSSYKVIGVAQDIWAMLALFNMQTATQRALKRKLKAISQKRQYRYQLNRNVGLGYLKRCLVNLLIRPLKQLGDRLDRLLELLLMAVEPVRPRKSRTRKKRIMRSSERHNYESNYRSVL